jgi:Bacterial lectin/Legume lectin domain/Chitobiase/beta-hexosaminidase C-terminal domain
MNVAFRPRVWVAGLLLSVSAAYGQVNVVTAHNDIARTGQNLNETILTPQNVNSEQFGKLFSQPVTGAILAQPLYVSQVTIPQMGVHNVVYVTTNSDMVFAFDADNNGGINAGPLWQASLALNGAPTGKLAGASGVVGTPVIDLTTNTMYVASSEKMGATNIMRLHALDITTGVEKFGAPVNIQATVPGTGSGSQNGMLAFNPVLQLQRPGLLLLNGVVYVGIASINDEGPWHGWIFSFSAATLQLLNVFCTTPNGVGGGLWMSGAGLAAEVYNPNKPYGRMFVPTGNGTFAASTPYASGMSYGMSLLDLDLTGGVMTVEDVFTPFDQAVLDAEDGDFGSGGPVLLPQQTLASGMTLNPLVQVGKSGTIYILDRDNNTDGSNNPATEYSPAGLGGFNANADQVVQALQTPVRSGSNWGAGVWGTEAYWNGNIYIAGTNPGTDTHYFGSGNNLSAYSFANGALSATPTSQSVEQYTFPGPTPSISANGNTNGIVWVLKEDSLDSVGFEVLLAYDATNLGSTLYSSDTNLVRDNPGGGVSFVVPTIANGKVYAGSNSLLNVYGVLANAAVAPAPTFTPSTTSYTGSQQVVISDALPNTSIYYTTNGSTPTVNSTLYTGPLTVSTNETITAMASATGYIQSPSASASYESTSTTANPVFSLAAGSYSGAQILAITTNSPGAQIYYTLDGSTPSTSSAVYTRALPVAISETVQAIAVAPGLLASSMVSATYSIQPVYAINFSNGFAAAPGPMQFNGSTDLDDFRLQLTNGGQFEAGSAFFATPVNIQAFTTQFTFQLSNPLADGMTFTIQNAGPTALGGIGGGLGYEGIGKSVAIKFDLYSNAGEGPDSTGLYTNGAAPTLPAINLTPTGINFHSGDYMNVNVIYDGTTLNLTITDAITLATWTQSFTINIPAIVGGNTAYVGFTGGTGGQSSSQKLTSWTYVAGAPVPNFAAGFAGGGMTLNGIAAINGSSLTLTNVNNFVSAGSAFFNLPVNVQQFTTSFDFQLADASADGFTFTIQGDAPTALGADGGSLGYGGIGNSIAVKFDLYSDNGEGPDSTGLFLNGVRPTVPAIDLTPSGINLHGSDVIHVQMGYTGTTLTVVITDTLTQATATQTYTVNIPAAVRGPVAYVGFTGSTGGLAASQSILDWTYNSTVSAAGSAFLSGFANSQAELFLNRGAVFNGSRLRLTDGGTQEAHSAFFATPLSIQQFSTGFTFQLTNAIADGFTFTIQNAGGSAVGGTGGQLGYGGIPTSVAVKFDLYSNAGEGDDSTGLYTNGASPTVPAINLVPTGINLRSPDICTAQLTYNGTTLTVVITDTVTGATSKQNYTVNIPAIVGGPTAYLGFTAGSGGNSAIQEILTWSYSPEI